MYESNFRIREPAFNLTPDPRFFYANASHQEAYATLCYGVEHRKGIIVITGDAGTGKTTLLRMFAQNATSTIHSSCILDPHLNFIELLRCTLDAFGLAPIGQDRVSMIWQLREYLIEQLKKGHIVALLLDEAQDLSDDVLEELRLLSNLEHESEKLLQIALIGHTDFESRLDQVSLYQFKQRIALRSRLLPLTNDDIRPYIDHRLSVAGYAGDPLFATSAIERIAFYSKGIPRLINMICDNALLIASATSQNRVGAETIEEVADELNLKDPCPSPTRPVVTETPELDFLEEFAGDSIVSVGRGAQTENRRVLDGANFSRSIARGYATVLNAKKWKRQAAVGCVIVVVILIGAVPYFFWQKSGVELPPVSGPIEEVFTPIRGLIDRVLMINGPTRIDSNVEHIAEGRRSDEERWWSSEPRKQSNLVPTKRKDPPRTLQSGFQNRPESNLKRADRTASSKPDRRPGGQVQKEEEKTPPLSRRSIRVVVENSLVRDEPTSNAEIIATLRPGAQIRLLGRKGDYWQIRSSEPEINRGYVHREDAFFAPLN